MNETKKAPVHHKKPAVKSEEVAVAAHAAPAHHAHPKKTKEKVQDNSVKYYGTGRRKEAIAKVWLVPGKGTISINGKTMLQYYCGRKTLEYKVNKPFVVTQTAGKYDVIAQVLGGGVPAQATAMSLGISRALVVANPDFKTLLKKEGLMTRDPRMKERKKYGLKRARRAFQFTKR